MAFHHLFETGNLEDICEARVSLYPTIKQGHVYYTFLGVIVNLFTAIIIVEDRGHPCLNPVLNASQQIVEILVCISARKLRQSGRRDAHSSYFFRCDIL